MRKCPICNSVGKEIFTGKIQNITHHPEQSPGNNLHYLISLGIYSKMLPILEYQTLPICNSIGKEIFTGKILKKYDVKYYQCPECALVYTESPYWLSEAYSDAISRYDTGVMQRNVMDVLLDHQSFCFLYSNFSS